MKTNSLLAGLLLAAAATLAAAPQALAADTAPLPGKRYGAGRGHARLRDRPGRHARTAANWPTSPRPVQLELRLLTTRPKGCPAMKYH